MSILLLAMMLPFVAIMIPLFKMFSAWKLVNTWIALGTAVDFDAVFDHDVPTGCTLFST